MNDNSLNITEIFIGIGLIVLIIGGIFGITIGWNMFKAKYLHTTTCIEGSLYVTSAMDRNVYTPVLDRDGKPKYCRN